MTLNELINSSNSNQQLCGREFVLQSGIHIAKHWSRSTFKSTGDQLVIRGQAANTTVICENVSLNISAPSNTTIDTLQFQNCKNIRIQKKKLTVMFKIVNSRFTNSCLEFRTEHTLSPKNHTLEIIIRNTTFVKSPCINTGSILSFTYSSASDKNKKFDIILQEVNICLLYTSPSPRDATLSRMPSSA